MRTTEAARYARWSAVVAGLLLLAVSGVSLHRIWEARQAEQQAPPAVPPSVEERSAQFSFSNTAGNRTVFTVRASRATEFKKDDRSLLEDVWITVYGNSGQRFDNLHTQACTYLPPSGEISCSGRVQIDLQNASDAHLHASSSGRAEPEAHILHVATSRVSFNRKSGVMATDQPVEFRFPNGEGRAVGIRYDSGPGTMRLQQDVQIRLQPTGSAGLGKAAAAGEIDISAHALVYRRGEEVLHLLGPVAVRQGPQELQSGQLDVDLDKDLRAQRITAIGHPQAHVAERGEPLTISADQFSASISAKGWIQKVIATGNVRGASLSGKAKERMASDRAVLDFANRSAQPERLTASGNVTVETMGAAGASWKLATSRLALDFGAQVPGDAVRLDRAATAAATLDWQGPAPAAGKGTAQRMQVKAQQLDAAFARNELRKLRGAGGVAVERQIGGAAPVFSSSRELAVDFAPGGDWSAAEQSGDVRIREGNRAAQASLARFERGNDRVALSGTVSLSDADSRTTANSAVFREAANAFHAQGGVVTMERSAGANGLTHLGPGPAQISADRLRVDTASGQAVYSGHARLWQGSSIIEASSIALDRQSKTVTAAGAVRAVFPSASWVMSEGASPRNGLLRAEAGRMVYASNQERIRLEPDATVQTGEGSIRSDRMDLFFGPEGKEKAAGKRPAGDGSGRAPASAGGNQKLVRAEAVGNVVVEQGDRRATAARGEYTAAQGKFVLSGGDPKVYDGSGNATSGRQLTFFFADDRIVIDSEEGSRTLTLHRVER